MRNTILFLAIVVNLAIAWDALLGHRPELFWWAVICATMLALASLVRPPGRKDGAE
jgi:hypothetical protein